MRRILVVPVFDEPLARFCTAFCPIRSHRSEPPFLEAVAGMTLGGSRRGALLCAVLSLFWMPTESNAQVVRGQVFEEGTWRPVVHAEVRLKDEQGAVRASASTDSAGVFLTGTRREGTYRIEVARLGYETVTTESFDLVADSVLDVVVRMGAEAVPLAPLEVTGRRESHLNRATYEGLYQRWARSPSVGSNRVLLPGDRDFQGAWTVRDLLRNKNLTLNKPTSSFRPGSSVECVLVVYWRGQQVRDEDWGEAILDTPTGEVEGVEIYNHLESSPTPFRPVLDNTAQWPCAAVVVWPKRAGDEPW